MSVAKVSAGLGAACIASAASFGAPAQAAETARVSQPVSGPFSSNVVPCQYYLCTSGQLDGSFPATYQFSLDITNREAPLARSIMTTRHGQLFADDSVVIGPPDTAGVMNIRAEVRIYDGTDRYLGAGGTIVATGTFDPTRTPNIIGTYSGEVRWTASSATSAPAAP